MTKDEKSAISAHWKTGFLGQLRRNRFDADACRDLTVQIRALPRLSEDKCDKECVYLIWMIPVFVEWQLARFRRDDIAYDVALTGPLTDAVMWLFDNPSKDGVATF